MTINKTKYKTSKIIVKVTEKIRKKLNDYITSIETILLWELFIQAET